MHKNTTNSVKKSISNIENSYKHISIQQTEKCIKNRRNIIGQISQFVFVYYTSQETDRM
jgi:hypothetical protein